MARKRTELSVIKKTLPPWLSFPATDLRGRLCRLEPFLDKMCKSWRRCVPDEHAALLRAWREAYPGSVLSYARGKRGTRAFAEQKNANADHFFLVQTRDPGIPPRTTGDIAYELRGATVPDFTGLSHHIDFFVSPPDMSWTMIYTHEVDVFGGPFFTRAEWVVPPASPARQDRWRRRHRRGRL
jgi:hypothetical protein